jgi:Domain of unknown function (DUF5666)
MRFYLFMQLHSGLSWLRSLPAVLMTWLALVVLALGLASCGGGVSGGGTGGGSTTPLTGAGPANNFGAVSGLGSIFVGDYEFDDALDKVSAQDGLPVSVGDLGLGVQVSVLNETVSQALTLNANNPTRSIQIKRMFMGVLALSPSGSDTLTINGQEVFLDRRTVVVGTGDTTALLGTMVQIAGYLEPTLNYILATRIEPASAAQIAQNQIYLSARVQSLDAASAIVSVGFATVSLASLQAVEPLQVNDFIRVQGTLNSKLTKIITAIKLTKLKPAAGEGDLTFRGIVHSRPTDANPDVALVVDGYEVQLADDARTVLPDLRRGSLVQVSGRLENLLVKDASVTIIDNPQVTLPGETTATWEEVNTGKNGSSRPDFRIYKSPVQTVNADGSFIVRGLRVRLVVPDGAPAPIITAGQIVSITGEASADIDGFYIRGNLIKAP